MNKELQLPQVFLQKMKQLLGDEYEAFLASYDKDRHYSLRINTLKLSKEDLLAVVPWNLTPVPWCSDGFYYEESIRPGKHPLHEAGLYYIQEASAMVVASLSKAAPGERILDLCAAPGGKSTHLASMMQGQGLLVSNEIHPARAKILSRNIERMGISNAVVTNMDPKDLTSHFSSFFDRIIVDAPCSGEGMFRKEDAAIPNWSPENVDLCAGRQREILSCAYAMLKTGGTLVYSTCTFSQEENEENVSWLKETYPIMQSVPLTSIAGHAPEELGISPGTDGTSLRLFPHKLKGEGHFLAVLTKGDPGVLLSSPAVSSSASEVSSTYMDKKSRKAAAKAAKRRGKARDDSVSHQEALSLWEDFADTYLKRMPKGIPTLFGSELYLLPQEFHSKGLKILRAGLHLGSVKKNRFEPSHALILALREEDLKQTIHYSYESTEISAYLRGESLPCTKKGWIGVFVNHYPLGWGKASGSQLKNHYPKGLRIP